MATPAVSTRLGRREGREVKGRLRGLELRGLVVGSWVVVVRLRRWRRVVGLVLLLRVGGNGGVVSVMAVGLRRVRRSREEERVMRSLERVGRARSVSLVGVCVGRKGRSIEVSARS